MSEINEQLLADIHRLGPFGSGNPEPILFCDQAQASHVKVVGRGHLRAKLRGDGAAIDAFGFSMAEQAELAQRFPVAIAFTAREIRTRGRARLELQIRGIRAAREQVPDRLHVVTPHPKIA
jgi:single-stranded-DNA-specific exonuclease